MNLKEKEKVISILKENGFHGFCYIRKRSSTYRRMVKDEKSPLKYGIAILKNDRIKNMNDFAHEFPELMKKYALSKCNHLPSLENIEYNISLTIY